MTNRRTKMKIHQLLFYCFFLISISSCKPDVEKSNTNKSAETIRGRISCPTDYSRENYDTSSWKFFLQNLKLLPDKSKILDFTGNPISNQSSHVAIINYDVGNRDLQQCADAIIRLRAEYLYEQKAFDKIEFKFTSGHNYKWTDHAKGIRPQVQGNSVTFQQTTNADASYSNFRHYLDIVFMYAGTISLNRDLKKIFRNKNLEIGDIIIKGGSPGHAVLIVDSAHDANGNYLYLLAESYIPAQSIHVLKSSDSESSPWFKINKQGAISSERYYFNNPNIRRFY
ncbi:hypothetical protein F6A46_00685 [Tenacibaculum finnmarkense genomovar ulcerans]|uniref:DUF4846 domain-containing protein n=1 Tax=Tenacibaculum finnmarkense TaxID=2781243 RepID=UPI00187B3524|nr:DUF4846 domain-containing protein [Tenacibaculum finnmarkense]MBE7686747.1 hypothetical protein [Tenacibaculum finnmarkense genomovar ulcerans]